jgi:hypothetical protein
MNAELDRQLANVLAKLGPMERKAVLDYARTLQGPDTEPEPWPSLMRFAGSICKEDIEVMRQVIEEEFERV